MKNKKHIKLTVLMFVLILIIIVVTACALDSANVNGNDNDTFIDRIITEGVRTFVLENMTDRQRLEQMTSITLYADGTAVIANALISSFLAPASQTNFIVEDNELAIYWERHETAIARFAIIGNDTLEFLFTDVPLRAEVGTRYVFIPDWHGIWGENVLSLCEEENEVYSRKISENLPPFAVALARIAW